MDKPRLYILEYAAYDSEPFHLLLSSALSERVVNDAQEIVKPILELFNNGLIKASYHSGISGDPYNPLAELKKRDLQSHIENNAASEFTSYPETGGEFFFRTTEKGLKLLNL